MIYMSHDLGTTYNNKKKLQKMQNNDDIHVKFRRLYTLYNEPSQSYGGLKRFPNDPGKLPQPIIVGMCLFLLSFFLRQIIFLNFVCKYPGHWVGLVHWVLHFRFTL